MLLKILHDLYNSSPLVRDVLQINESMRELRGVAKAIERRLNDVDDVIRLAATRQTSNFAMRLLDFKLDRHPRYSDPLRLPRYFGQVSSQNGEDGAIHEIFRRIGTDRKVFAEVGVGDGSENNTAFLLAQGWTGFWVDGDRAFEEMIASRPDISTDCLRCAIGLVSRENITPLFEKLGVPTDFDLLALDVDQNTYYLREGLAAYRPRAVVVEYNAAIPPDVEWRVRYEPNRHWDGTQNFGASLKAYETLGAKLGYCLVGCDFLGANAFFMRGDLAADHFASPFTAENHYEPPRYSLLHRRSHRSALLDRTDG
jgi:hypothetical protein